MSSLLRIQLSNNLRSMIMSEAPTRSIRRTSKTIQVTKPFNWSTRSHHSFRSRHDTHIHHYGFRIVSLNCTFSSFITQTGYQSVSLDARHHSTILHAILLTFTQVTDRKRLKMPNIRYLRPIKCLG